MPAHRLCDDCGRITTTTKHCPCRSQHYGAQHQADRLAWVSLVLTGTVICSRFNQRPDCTGLILNGDDWALDHVDGTTRPAHKRCNDGAH